MSSRMRRAALISLVAVAIAAAGFAAAVPAAPAQRPSARPAKLAVAVEVLHFTAAGKKLTATGLVSAKLSSGNTTQVVRSKIAVTASTGGGCKILHLYLKQLNLVLLGLNVHLDKVILDITGDPHGGVLGSLFCKLATAKVAAARASAVHTLNAQLARANGPQRVLRFVVAVQPKARTAAVANCQVLDLILGPLNLQLLGLVVNLNQVHLTITATPGGGVLGNLFCALASSTATVP